MQTLVKAGINAKKKKNSSTTFEAPAASVSWPNTNKKEYNKTYLF